MWTIYALLKTKGRFLLVQVEFRLFRALAQSTLKRDEGETQKIPDQVERATFYFLPRRDRVHLSLPPLYRRPLRLLEDFDSPDQSCPCAIVKGGNVSPPCQGHSFVQKRQGKG